MSQEELAKGMLLPMKLIKIYEKRNVDPLLRYYTNSKAIFNVTGGDINRLKTTEGVKNARN